MNYQTEDNVLILENPIDIDDDFYGDDGLIL